MRFFAIAATLVGLSCLPAAAQPHQSWQGTANAGYAQQPGYDVSKPNFGQGSRCVTDEGYGRWSYCDSN
ncbi:hypothetical protein RA307_29970 [Xanthobacteraceae bacterium Astr-EGSB]|uniref:hypothetical protein n=1 Tax=Astrobacterium formosum TaxID=3069710 RepID=UPI0027B39EE4|nr:hypothetical protein [Xanthobacteraceae bacterium Astr-EGSB]